MDSRYILRLIFITFILYQSQAESIDDGNSVLFVDSSSHQYLRRNVLTNSMSAKEVGATVSVLLGFTPADLSAASSAKLNELLMPNPFDRPRHVFMLEVGLAQDSQAMVYTDNAVFSSGIKSKMIPSAGGAEIDLPDEVAFFSVDEQEFDSDLAISAKEISDFASSFGGSYVSANMESQNGQLIIPLSSGSKLSLHMSKEGDRKFATGLIHMINNIRKIMDMKQDLSGSKSDLAELVGGYFDGIKSLQEEYHSEDIIQQAVELLLTTLSKVFDTLQASQRGQAVAVILFSKAHSSQPQKMLDLTYASRLNVRMLEEAKVSSNSTKVAEVILVRLTVAWTTGIMLIIATIIAVYSLLGMQVTKDTLLYSNVKLD